MKLVPMIFHEPSAVQEPWSHSWVCMRCGPWDSSARELPACTTALELAADCMGLAQWQAVTAADFWEAVRARASELVRGWHDAGRHSYRDAGPPLRLTVPTNSQIYVPLLLDAAGVLSATAQHAWRQHELTSTDWEHWIQALQAAQPVSVAFLLRKLQVGLRNRARIDPLSKDICLLWHRARQMRGVEVHVTIGDVVISSQTQLGYLPGLVQEILLESFGGQQLSQAVAHRAAAMRVRSAEGIDVAAAGPSVPSDSAGRFVRGSDLVTGHGWNRAAAAASESCDVPGASQPAAPAPAPPEFNITGSGSGSSLSMDPAAEASAEPASAPGEPPQRCAASDAAPAPAGATAQNFNIAVDGDDESTGLTQDVSMIDLRAQPAASEGDDAAASRGHEQPASGRRVRRRRQGPEASWEILRCRMCSGADAFHAQDSRGLMQHLVRAHLGQQLTADAITQLRHLGKEACRICASIRASTNPRCSSCNCATATRPLQMGDVVPDRRRPAPVGQDVPREPVPAAAARAASTAVENLPADADSDGDTGPSFLGTQRQAHVSAEWAHAARNLSHLTAERIPVSSLALRQQLHRSAGRLHVR